ncbi:pentatricopeptide repeat-containing protein At2g03880, mitochondrial-like [Mangifera indica]|uniref:pentatricopeptide repeat-containing protein At2g03880, mitochondrial-like n=1 Tax=Mangifera indica TaxID=29780 RepID=UPI001CF9B0A7|nr:pentatricopeptide repeat-containing protein At2g03880, mitochondrial-like [Mangifera indica]
MASTPKLFLSGSFSYPYPVKDQVKVKKCNYLTTCMVNQQVTIKTAYKLSDRSPERSGVSTTDLSFNRYMNDEEKGVIKNGYFSTIGTFNDVFSDGERINDAQVSTYSSRSLLDGRFVISILSFCSREGCLELGKRYHALIIKNGIGDDQFVGTSLVDMYAKCRDMDSAVRLINHMPFLDVSSCNCLISGYANSGLFDEAFSFFMKLDTLGVRPNHYTYSSMLALCGSVLAIEEGKQVHAQIVKTQHSSKTSVYNGLLTLYTKCGMMKDAESLFESLVHRDVISWTAMINGWRQHGGFRKALRLVCLMREGGVDPNEYTYTVALASCASMKNLDCGCMFHAQVLKLGMALGDFVGTSIVNMYSRLGKICDAIKQLKEMGKMASNISWNAQIAGLVHNGKATEAVEAFNEMVKNDAACDEFTYSIILKACSLLPSLATCEQVHSLLVKTKFESNIHVGSSLIEAYNNSGSMEDAEKVFSRMSKADVVALNSMIKAYSQNGYPRKAIILFQKMVEEGIKPTNISFLAVLSACSHSGLVQEGHKLFESMKKDYGIQPEETHYSCMVDLMGRAGQLENALDFINNLPIKPTAPIWRPLLAACRWHSNLRMAEFVAKKILHLDPKDGTVYVILSNMYTEAGKHLDAENQRKLMTLEEAAKEPGCSWIEVDNKIYRFFSRDKSHPAMPKVYEKLKQVKQQMENIEQTPYGKEDIILHHSEKLAVCFGLISLPAKKQIRVFKNLRVCRDCHSFMKYISKIAEKEIVLRDNYRFHHFKQGSCSCGDYW